MTTIHPSPVMAKKNAALAGIQHLRGVAAVMVVMAHVTAMSRFEKYFGYDILGRFFEAGAVGVELFFVISGFIIAYASLNVELKPKLSSLAFFQKRLVRIVPLMWVCIISYGLLRYAGRGVFDPLPYARALFLYPVGEVAPTVIWTLRHEALFYTVFCASWLLGPLRFYALAAWFVSPLLLLALGDPWQGSEWCNFIFNRLNMLFGFGFAIAVLYLKGYLKPRMLWKPLYILSLLAGGLLMWYANASEFVGPQHVRTTYDVFKMACVVALMVVVMLSVFHANSQSLGNRLFQWLGDASYSIYLFHEFFVSAALGFWSLHNKTADPVLVLVVVSVGSTLGSIGVYWIIEKPLLSKLNRLMRSSR